MLEFGVGVLGFCFSVIVCVICMFKIILWFRMVVGVLFIYFIF